MAVNSKKPTSRTTKPNSRNDSGAVAGPSSKPATAQTGTKRKNRTPEPSDVEGRYGQTEDEEAAGRSKAKKANTGGDAGANGKTSLKGKGKAKADPPPTKVSKKAGTLMEVDEAVEETDGYATEKPTHRSAAALPKKLPRQATGSDKELSNLRQKLLDVRV